MLFADFFTKKTQANYQELKDFANKINVFNIGFIDLAMEKLLVAGTRSKDKPENKDKTCFVINFIEFEGNAVYLT